MNSLNKITTLFIDIGGVILENGWDRGKRRRASELFSCKPPGNLRVDI